MLRNAIAMTTLMLLVGCSSTVPPELVDARAAYQRAAATRGSGLAQTDLYEARQALGRAESSYSDVGSKPETRDLAYVAERKAQIARSRATALASMEQARNAQLERQHLEQQRNAAARMNLERAKGELAQKDAVISAERQARMAAESAKEDERGLVLTMGSAMLFGPSEAKIAPAAQERLTKIAELLAKSKRQVVVVGHTDSSGKAEKNEALSQKRADAVRTFLVDHGVPEERIRAEGVASSQPIADNKTTGGRASNRRVEIILQK